MLAETPDLLALGNALGHVFSRPELLLEAVTHRSYVHENARANARDNERLEFLGDAVLGFVTATMLHDRHPEANEGELTQRRAAIVSGTALAEVARAIELGTYLRLGRGEERTAGRGKARLLASALEACMAAVYLDGGVDAAMRVADKLWSSTLDALVPGAQDFKTRMQERVQALGKGPLSYRVVEVTGPDHDRAFRVSLYVQEQAVGEGRGRSKSEAEQDAARIALETFALQSEESP